MVIRTSAIIIVFISTFIGGVVGWYINPRTSPVDKSGELRNVSGLVSGGSTITSTTFGLTWPLKSEYSATVEVADERLGAVVNLRSISGGAAILVIYRNTFDTSQPSPGAFGSWIVQLKQLPAPISPVTKTLLNRTAFVVREPNPNGDVQDHLYILGPLFIYELIGQSLDETELEALFSTAEVAT